MKTFEIKTTFTVYESEKELSEEDQKLLKMARNAANRAYAVYSQFHVGAALLLDMTGNISTQRGLGGKQSWKSLA